MLYNLFFGIEMFTVQFCSNWFQLSFREIPACFLKHLVGGGQSS